MTEQVQEKPAGEKSLVGYKIAVIVGSLRRDSFNQKLAARLVATAPADLLLNIMQIGTLPLYNQDDDDRQAPEVKKARQAVLASHGVIFVTPEYNRSIPGVLKNAIDHLSRPYGDSAWEGKPAGIIGVSEGPLGTGLAQQHLRNILASLDMPTLGLPEAFIQMKNGSFIDIEGETPDIHAALTKWMAAYASWIKRHGSAKNIEEDS